MLNKFFQPRLRAFFLAIFGIMVFSAGQLMAQEIPTEDAAIQQGRTLFVQNCQQCHAVDRKLVGPALKDVQNRHSVSWLVKFITNSQKLIASGDAEAIAIWNEYNKTEMPAFDYLSEGEILNILGYIVAESDKPADVVVAEAGTAGAAGAVGGATGGLPTEYLTAILVALVVILALILFVLGLLVSVLNRFLSQKEGLSEEDKDVVAQKTDLGKFFKSPGFVGLMIMLFVAVIGKSAIDGLYTIGVQQGYAPKQPIAFSHQLHAGQYEIDCQYCHTGVEISKNANIPSVNICMNCHSAIKTESPEIQKLYLALENNKPIEWVRIHNLPDLAYFNHAQHVKVGGVECQTCHGPIEEMDVVYQYSSLTMGWCIDCHRNTEIKVENGYYDKLAQLHSGAGKSALKVADIGGLECAKCHY
jgi:mono/diheme cytochrome c family protein